MQDLLKSITNVSFTFALAAYILVRIEGKINSLSDTINQLSAILSVKLSDSNKTA